MESEKSGFVNEMSEIWRKMQVKYSNGKQNSPRVPGDSALKGVLRATLFKGPSTKFKWCACMDPESIP